MIDTMGGANTMAKGWTPLSEWQNNITDAMAFLPDQVLERPFDEPLPEWILKERCYSFNRWSYRFSIRNQELNQIYATP